ncbi:MAG: DUF6268 family outer membrane beta-barrel protein [Sediminibacterium sp.]|nr:DUF6268 family outer membrane beta-barrel protein [Sediminibacterium sp.]
MRLTLTLICLLSSLWVFSQTDTTENFDYSNFGDADGVKRFCTQKVLNQTPQRIISLGFEQYGAFEMPGVSFLTRQAPAQININQVNAIRAQVNVPVISTNKLIWQMGVNYWSSKFNVANPNVNEFATALSNNALLTAGLNTTVFKPLNEKNFLIFQASADVNGLFENVNDIQNKAMTASGTIIYGWKTSEKNMIGAGLARTYRAGRLLHVPVLFWNKTFNDKWGMELLLPARGFVRYNFSTTSMLQAGFELEGNQFLVRLPQTLSINTYIQRGEVKPRIMWDKKLTGFLWLNAQAGLRYNYRFDVVNRYDAMEESQRFFSSNLGNPLFFNISLNFVSP